MLNALTIILLFAAAWAVSRLSAVVARRVMAWSDRRHRAPSGDLSAKIVELKRRETSVAVIRTGIAYIAFATALVLTAAQLTGGFGRLTAVAGASFILILVGFSAQRMLMDIIAGFNMFVEHWYSVGDTIAIPMMEVQGIVEDLSLRRTKLRSQGKVLDDPLDLHHRDRDRVADGVPVLDEHVEAGDDVHQHPLRGEADEDEDEGGARHRGQTAEPTGQLGSRQNEGRRERDVGDPRADHRDARLAPLELDDLRAQVSARGPV